MDFARLTNNCTKNTLEERGASEPPNEFGPPGHAKCKSQVVVREYECVGRKTKSHRLYHSGMVSTNGKFIAFRVGFFWKMLAVTDDSMIHPTPTCTPRSRIWSSLVDFLAPLGEGIPVIQMDR